MKAFMNSYKQKNDDFHKLFRLPPEDRLLVDYSCALQREILAHGRLYLSLKHLCFRANIVGWETTVTLFTLSLSIQILTSFILKAGHQAQRYQVDSKRQNRQDHTQRHLGRTGQREILFY